MIPDSEALNAVSRDFSRCPFHRGKYTYSKNPNRSQDISYVPIKIISAVVSESKFQQRYTSDQIRNLSFYDILLSKNCLPGAA